SPGLPIMFSAGTRAPSNTTWPNSLVMPLIMRSGDCSIPCCRIGTAKADRPFCFGTSGSVRASRKHQSATSEELVQILWPWITYSSPSRVTVVRNEARSDPASGSLKPWHQRSRPLIRPGRKRCWIASLACVVIPWTRYPRLGRGGAPAAGSSSSRMTSKTAGRSWPPKREGQERPKKPASYSAVCHSACRAQYSSSVEETGRPGLCAAIQARSRDRNSASAGESRKSVGHPQTHPLELAQLLAVVPEPLRGEQCPAEIDVYDAVPRVSDSAVHLHRGLAHGACGARAVGFGDAP